MTRAIKYSGQYTGKGRKLIIVSVHCIRQKKSQSVSYELTLSMYRYYTETRGDIFMPRGEAEGQKYINPSFCVIPDIHTTGKVFSYFTVHSSEYSN